MERTITEFEEIVIRLVHHDFEGLTQQEAAKQMQCSQALISRTISRLEKKAPQLFPILTKEQAFVRACIADEGLNHQEIARLLDVSKDTVDSIVATLKAKGVYFEKPHKMVRYETYLDNQIIKKF